MTIDVKTRDERLKYNINREAKKSKKKQNKKTPRLYHHVKLIYMIVLQVKKYHPHIYIVSFRKSFKKTNKTQVDALILIFEGKA